MYVVSTYYSYKYHMELNILYNDNIKSFRVVHLHSNLITCYIWLVSTGTPAIEYAYIFFIDGKYIKKIRISGAKKSSFKYLEITSNSSFCYCFPFYINKHHQISRYYSLSKCHKQNSFCYWLCSYFFSKSDI